jgi:IS30 family transposase
MRKLKAKWSPELIAGRLPLEHPEFHISHEAIYQFIYEKATRKELNLVPYLARAHKRREATYSFTPAQESAYPPTSIY